MTDDLLDTVSKALALHDEAHHRLVCECVLCDPNTQLRGWLRSLLARCREAETALADLRERDHVLSKHLEDRATARDPLAQSLIAAEDAALERAKQAESALAVSRASAGEMDIRLAGVEAERDHYREAEKELAALRERHAEDVEHAFAAGVTFTATCTDQMSAGLRKWPEYKAKWARREP